jgi:hypothetical protein
MINALPNTEIPEPNQNAARFALKNNQKQPILRHFLVFSSGKRTTSAQNMYGNGPTFGAKATSIPNSSAYTPTKSPLLSACFRERALIPVP